jgi:hypothetical protein
MSLASSLEFDRRIRWRVETFILTPRRLGEQARFGTQPSIVPRLTKSVSRLMGSVGSLVAPGGAVISAGQLGLFATYQEGHGYGS